MGQYGTCELSIIHANHAWIQSVTQDVEQTNVKNSQLTFLKSTVYPNDLDLIEREVYEKKTLPLQFMIWSAARIA